MKSVRWDEENAIALCFGCHQYLGSHPVEHVRLFQERLGIITLDLLECRAYQTHKPDKKALELYYSKKLDDLLT